MDVPGVSEAGHGSLQDGTIQDINGSSFYFGQYGSGYPHHPAKAGPGTSPQELPQYIATSGPRFKQVFILFRNSYNYYFT